MNCMHSLRRDAGSRRGTNKAGDALKRGQASGSCLPYVLLIFGIAFAARVISGVLVRNAPTIVIDESLYINLAKSLAAGHGVAYRDQPINYPYLLYPLLLTPVYWIRGLLGGDPYRWIQTFNTLAISSSVFPAYMLGKEFSGSERTGLLTAAATALMPDMIFGCYLLTESVIWPLSLWMMTFARQLYAGESRLRYGLLTAVFAALLYWTKPGAVAMGAVLLIVHAVRGIRSGECSLREALSPAGVLLLMIALVYGVYFLLGGTHSTMLGLYDKQLSGFRPADLLVMGEGTVLGVFLFVFACGGIFALIPLVWSGGYTAQQRTFMTASAAGLAAAILGTAVFVVPYQWSGGFGQIPMHLRYFSMYIPVFFAYAVTAERPRRKTGRAVVIALIVFALLCIFPGARAGFVSGESSPIDSVTLSAFCRTGRLDSDVTGWTLTVMTILFALFLLSSIPQEGWGKKMKGISMGFFAVLLLFNNVCGYINANARIDPADTADAREVDSIVGDETAIGLMQRHYDDIYTYLLESRLGAPMQQVTTDQIIYEADLSGGIYVPFVPVDQAPNINDRMTPDTDLFVLGKTVAEHLELNPCVDSYRTMNGRYTIARIVPGRRWVDTMIYGLYRNTLEEDTEGILGIFDPGRNIGGSVRLHLTAEGNGTLTVGGTELSLTKDAAEYDVTVPYASRILMRAEGEVRILSYSTDTAEQ